MLWQGVFRSHRTIVIFPLIINVCLYCFRFNGYFLPNTAMLREKTLCMFSKASFGGFYTKCIKPVTEGQLGHNFTDQN